MLKMSDIATHAGVSPTTVSFVLNDRHETVRISEKTRLKVLKAAEELGYRSNQLARAMRTGNTRMLGILGGYPAEEQVGKMLAGALEAADAQGYTLKILRLDAFGSAQQVIRRISELRLMGMIALHLPDPVLHELHVEAKEYNTPLVLMDARCDNPNIAQIVSDDEGGIALGVDHLVELGHTGIAFIGDGASALGAAREAAYRAALARHGIEVRPGHVQHGAFSVREESLRAARALLELPFAQRPTAILCSGDLIALATLQVASELQLRVPQALSVVGFANLSVAEYSTPPLTTIEQPFKQMGRVAVEMLLSAINERSQDGDSGGESLEVLKIRVLPTRLIERASTAAPKK